jgi:phosphoglycerol transferase MdoB-like AlkP superfamily enzyme
MNKKLNTVFFILAATLFNVLVAIISFFLLAIIYLKFLYNLIPEQNNSWIFAVIFLAAIVISFIAYRYLLKYLLKKIDVDKYFDPIFVRRNIRKTGS